MSRILIIDAVKGKTYQCSISMDKPDRIKVRGYVGIEILGRTMFLKRIKNEASL